MLAKSAETVGIRRAAAGEQETLALIGAATFLDAYAGKLDGRALLAFCGEHHSVEAWREVFREAANRVWLAEIDPGAAPVGYAALVARSEMPADVLRVGDVELKRIYVLSRFYGAGVAQRLMQVAIESARESGAERLLVGLHRNNLRAMAFYQRLGFVEVGVRRFTVGDCCFEDPVMALGL